MVVGLKWHIAVGIAVQLQLRIRVAVVSCLGSSGWVVRLVLFCRDPIGAHGFRTTDNNWFAVGPPLGPP